MRRTGIAIAVLGLVAVAGCSDGDEAPDALPSFTGSPSKSPSASSSPSIPPYLEKYTPAERASYAEASAAYDEFIEREAEFAAAGRTTVKAKDFYQKYSLDWATSWGSFAYLANLGVRIFGVPETVSERPTQITLEAAKGQVVVVRRCLDSRDLKVTQNGKPSKQPQLQQRRTVTVELVQREREDWWRAGVAKQGKPC